MNPHERPSTSMDSLDQLLDLKEIWQRCLVWKKLTTAKEDTKRSKPWVKRNSLQSKTISMIRTSLMKSLLKISDREKSKKKINKRKNYNSWKVFTFSQLILHKHNLNSSKPSTEKSLSMDLKAK